MAYLIISSKELRYIKYVYAICVGTYELAYSTSNYVFI